MPSLGAGTVIQQLSDAGALTEWVDFGGVGTAVMGRLIGFGADARFYALAASAQDDFGIGDVVVISPDAPAWKLAASSVLQGDGEAGGPPLSLDAYGSAFAPDGSLYFFGCESGCAGDGNAFTLGVYRLVLGGAQ